MKVYCFFLLIAIGAIQTALALDIPEIPLEVLVQSPSPIIMLLIDDSSSMNASILASPDNEILSNYFYVFDDPENHVLTSLTSLQTIIPPDQAGSWQARCSGYNRLYYNPHKIYFPWPYWSEIQEDFNDKNADLNCPRYHPLKSKCLNLDDPYFTNENISLSYAHFFSFDDTNANAILDFDETLFLIELSGKDQLLFVHKIIQPDLGIAKENMEQVSLSQLPESIRLNTSGEPMNYTHQRQNFANWFSFHRRKEFVIKYQMACLVDKVRAFIGIYSFNQSIVFPVQHVDPSEKELTEAKKAILEQIYSYISKGDSPLREAYQTVGNYLDTGSDSVIKGRSPFIQNTEGDSCRQAFVVVLTDGDYNGPSPNIGNCDIDGGSNDSLFDGPPYGDLYENTFADLSMYYYERDLAPGIPNMIPAFASDIASHQHMVPLIIVFDSKNMKDKYSNYPEWPKPSPETGQTMIDLFHAAVNGRGFFGNAGDPFEFSDVIQQIDGYIQNSQTIITGSTQVGSSVQTQTQSQLLETSYNSINWTGDLKAYDISSAQTLPKWSAKDKLEQFSENDRHIFTFNGQKGVPFRKEFMETELTSEQIANIRQASLGDIVHSTPVVVNQTVWVGANDGMLHGFDLDTGIEKIAYIPKMIWPSLHLLAEKDSKHAYFIDGNCYAYDTSEQKLLCGTLGRGGKGVFCLNLGAIPENMSDETEVASKLVLWEYSPVDDQDLGYVQKAYIVKSNLNNRLVVIFGNGYNSDRNQPFLYILDAQTGRPLVWGGKSWKKGIELPFIGAENGLSIPALVDTDNNRTVDFIYAGDLHGNLWKIDCQSSNPKEWRVAYEDEDNQSPKPLFQALSPTGQPQPITIRPEVIRHCDSRFMGYLVIFGTGKYLEKRDIFCKRPQSLYVIWDWADYWKIQQNESLSKVRNRYLGTFNHVINGLSEIRKPDNTPAHISLFKQNIDQYTQTSLPINWDPETDQSHVGWYIDLNPGSGERIIAPLTYLNDNVLIFITFTPTDSPCKAGGISHLYAVNIANTLNYKEIFQSMSENISLFLQPIDGMLHPPLISYQGSDQMILTFSSSAMPSISKIVLKENKHFKMRGIFDRRLFYWKAY